MSSHLCVHILPPDNSATPKPWQKMASQTLMWQPRGLVEQAGSSLVDGTVPTRTGQDGVSCIPAFPPCTPTHGPPSEDPLCPGTGCRPLPQASKHFPLVFHFTSLLASLELCQKHLNPAPGSAFSEQLSRGAKCPAWLCFLCLKHHLVHN